MLYIFAGHTADKKSPKYDPGASGNGYTEAELTVRTRDKLVAKLVAKNSKVVIDNDYDSLAQVLAKAPVKASDVILDIHYNAGPTLATGLEVIIPDRNTLLERDYATQMSLVCANTLGIKNRGVKTEKDTARKTLAVMREEGSNFLIEVCFISNKSDLDKYFSKEDEMLTRLADMLIEIDNKEV